MKTFTNEDIRKFDPCYDPIKYLSNDGVFTVIDILDHAEIPFEDKLWVILRTDYISERLMRLFAVWSYRQTLQWVKDPDPRSIEAANVAERFANGEATDEELSAAWSAAQAAWSAARAAAWSVAESAQSAARAAAWSVAESAQSAAQSAVQATAWSAARAAHSAAQAAAWSARSVAESAQSAAWSTQQAKLREMILAGIETGDTK